MSVDEWSNDFMYTDRVSWIDPALLSFGFLLVLTCLTLSQFIREHSQEYIRRQGRGWAFWTIRKVLVVGMLRDLALGFWIVGWPWLIIAPLMMLLAVALTNLCMSSGRPGLIVRIAGVVGISLTSWAEAPLLKAWGVLP
ncbi:MAG: hypothetical protein EBR34_11850 [Sphingomonadaceae bacterium]|nr:hypothetical protein [Sphingomonadaceae bacterium]